MRTHGVHGAARAPGHELPGRAEAPRPKAQDWVEVALEVTHNQIASRAYEIFVARGGRPGDALGDWLAAEHELRAMAMTVPRRAGRRAVYDPAS